VGTPPERRPAASVSAVIVAYGCEPEQLRGTIASLRAQSVPPRELIVVDNGGAPPLAAALAGEREVRVIGEGRNVGYPAAVNRAVAAAAGEHVLCINPDARAEPGCLAELLAAMSDPQVALAGAQILLGESERVNAGANPLHPSGISPAGGYGAERELGDPRAVAVVSGACCLIRRSAFALVGGMREELFLYYEDVDLAWRLLIAGFQVLFCPRACARHDYEFARHGQRKWLLLERNRLACVLSNYEARTLLALAPALAATELGLLAVAALGGWLPAKLGAYRSLLAMRGSLRARRRQLAALRRRADRELIGRFALRLDSALLPPPGPAALNALWLPYRLLGARARAR